MSLDTQILLKSSPLTSLAGSAPGLLKVAAKLAFTSFRYFFTVSYTCICVHELGCKQSKEENENDVKSNPRYSLQIIGYINLVGLMMTGRKV